MKSLGNSQNNQAVTTAAIQRLARAVMVATGEFALILACCNSVNKQQQILSLVKEFTALDIQEITLSPSVETLYTTITNTLGASQPEALVIQGLESVVAINQLVISTNLMRDEFRKNFRFPLVLWVNDEILSKLVWLAPDMKNWAASTIRFDVSNNQLIESPVLSA
jgi:hypothetical protein